MVRIKKASIEAGFLVYSSMLTASPFTEPELLFLAGNGIAWAAYDLNPHMQCAKGKDVIVL